MLTTTVEPRSDVFERRVEDKTFWTHDGVSLFYRYWPAVADAARGAIVLFHRCHEHSGRTAHLATELDPPDFAVFAWDGRGQGPLAWSTRLQPESWRVGARRADIYRSSPDHLRIRGTGYRGRGTKRWRGAVATWAHDYAPKIRCMVLASPAFRVKLYEPFARSGLKIMHALRGNCFVNSYAGRCHRVVD